MLVWLRIHPFPSFLRLIHHSFFSVDDAKTTLFSLARVHITKDHIPQHSWLIIEAHTSDFSRYVVPNIYRYIYIYKCGEREHTRKVNTPTGADAVRKNLYDYTQLFFFVVVYMCAPARSFLTNNITVE